jgi:cytochrome b involved in lipid metabolism
MNAQGYKTFSRQQVASHSSKDSCWIIIDRNVYDVTGYLFQHPGGSSILLDPTMKGKDRGQEFRDNDHSGMAKATLKQYFIGVLV